MSMMMLSPESAETLLEISSALGGFVNKYDLAPDRDIVVYCFNASTTDWEHLPAAWHRPVFGEIVLNFAKILKSLATGPDGYKFREMIHQNHDGSYWASKELVESTAKEINKTMYPNRIKYQTYTPDGRINTKRLSLSHPRITEPLTVKTDSAVIEFRTPAQTLMGTLLAVILHETGHSVFSKYITEDWYGELSGYKRKVMTMFEELRAENQQLKRIGAGTSLIRRAADVVVDPRTVAQDIQDAQRKRDGKVNLANLALNSTLCLGRGGYGVFLAHELVGLRDLVEISVGDHRLTEMERIWKEFSDIRDTDPDRMVGCVDEWISLFPSAKDGSGVSSSISVVIKLPKPPTPPEPEPEEVIENDGSDSSEPAPAESGGGSPAGEVAYTSDDPEPVDEYDPDYDPDAPEVTYIDMSGEPPKPQPEKDGTNPSGDSDGEDPDEEELNLPGMLDELDDLVQQAADKAVTFPQDQNQDHGPADITPTSRSFAAAEATTRSKQHSIRTVEPSSGDRVLAASLAQELSALNVMDRAKFKVNSQNPIGRLRPRAAIQQAADRAAGRVSTAKPWRGYKRTVDLNPPLTVGIMTDTSASQRWATEFSSRVAWIISTAVSKINGKTAALTFGSSVVITTRPGEHTGLRKEVPALDQYELFDTGVGAMDSLLNLTSGVGVRILFVATDGRFNHDGGLEMVKAAKWVAELKRSGCLVVWIAPTDARNESRWGLPCLPNGASPLWVDSDEVARNPAPAIRQLVSVVEKEMALRRGR